MMYEMLKISLKTYLKLSSTVKSILTCTLNSFFHIPTQVLSPYATRTETPQGQGLLNISESITEPDTHV